MDIEYTWILWQGKNFSQLRLLTWNSFIDQFAHLVRGDGSKCGIAILARCKFHFIREHENQV